MKTPDQEVLETLHKWILNNTPCVLITVAQTWGSSPRAVGSIMCISVNGENEGSVSGGCVEEDLIDFIKRFDFTQKKPVRRFYGVDPSQARKFGLPCGGKLELIIENVTRSREIGEIISALINRKTIQRKLNLVTGGIELYEGQKDLSFYCDDNYVIKTFGPAWQMIIIGAGHLSKHLAAMTIPLGYDVIVCDPRIEHTDAWKIEYTRVDSRMPDDVVADLSDEFTAIIALTHDPKLDDMALMQALDSKAFYVGALGSKLNSQKRLQRLASLGVSPTGLSRLHGPVGLPIGSHTPPEIAISILAQVIACRNGVSLINKMSEQSENGVSV